MPTTPDFPWGEAIQNGSLYTIIMALIYILSAIVAGLVGVLYTLVKGLQKISETLAANTMAIELLEKQCGNTQEDVRYAVRGRAERQERR